MPRNSRRDFPGLFHHIMSQGINKEYIFDNDKLKKMYIDLIKEKSEKNNVKIMAFTIEEIILILKWDIKYDKILDIVKNEFEIKNVDHINDNWRDNLIKDILLN